jgi:hypothetical protein
LDGFCDCAGGFRTRHDQGVGHRSDSGTYRLRVVNRPKKRKHKGFVPQRPQLAGRPRGRWL